jgi:hypothetical protein
MMVLAFFWGMAEASLFFIVPDVLVSLVALRRGWHRGAMVALGAAFGALLGGAIMLAWASRDPAVAVAAVALVPNISDAMMAGARADLAARGVMALAVGGLSGVPYKIYAVEAPGLGLALPVLLATLPVRLARFLAVAAVAAGARRLLEGARLGPGAQTLVLLTFWLVFYLWFFRVMPE